jgi:hypothetical protein
MQIDALQTVGPDPLEYRLHYPLCNSAPPKFRLAIDVQNHRPLRARVMRIRRPRREQHPASARHDARRINGKPMPIRSLRQCPRQPRPRHLNHAIQFFSRPFSHIAKHQPPMMQDGFKIVGASLAKCNLRFTHEFPFPFPFLPVPLCPPWSKFCLPPCPDPARFRHVPKRGDGSSIVHYRVPFSRGRCAGAGATNRRASTTCRPLPGQ